MLMVIASLEYKELLKDVVNRKSSLKSNKLLVLQSYEYWNKWYEGIFLKNKLIWEKKNSITVK